MNRLIVMIISIFIIGGIYLYLINERGIVIECYKIFIQNPEGEQILVENEFIESRIEFFFKIKNNDLIRDKNIDVNNTFYFTFKNDTTRYFLKYYLEKDSVLVKKNHCQCDLGFRINSKNLVSNKKLIRKTINNLNELRLNFVDKTNKKNYVINQSNSFSVISKDIILITDFFPFARKECPDWKIYKD